MTKKLNCWEFKKCGREAGGAKVQEFGNCPAFEEDAGEACWLVAGTFCGGEKQGTFAQKEHSCMKCDFYKLFDLTHRSKVRIKLAQANK